jgi:transposase
MANVLSEDKKQQVIALGRLGWSLRRIERETGIRRETAGLYLRFAGVAVRPAGWGGKPPAKPAIEVTTDSEASCTTEPAPETTSECAIRPQRSPSASACEPYQELIELGLGRGRNAVAIWQDLVSYHGFTGGYQSVKRFVRQLRGAPTPAARVVIITAPGEESQVDYGAGPMVRDPFSGKYRRTRLFVMTLAYSRKAVRLLTFRSSSRIWAELHERAFRRLGGATRVVVLDNLREGVLVPDVYDPTLNPLYRDVLLTTVPWPCPVACAIVIAKAKSSREWVTHRRRR